VTDDILRTFINMPRTMYFKIAAGILIASFFQPLLGQIETYDVKKASFSSDIYDEYSPVYYKNGIVFCSNRNAGLLNRSTSQNKGLFKIYYIDSTQNTDWKSAKLFSKNLVTIFNDGPVTFNRLFDTIYYSRNLEAGRKLSDISGPRNKLGIFNAVMTEGQWTKIRELRLNNEWYNVTTPYLSPDGKRLYFASDKSGGFGGSDLYYCQWKSDHWDNPVNLGPAINTTGNEAYPYVNREGGLFFSSDGHPGLGGKDIFYSKETASGWLPPVRLDAPVNSRFDDFGFIADSVMSEGYFSSKRDSSIDIYHFKTNFHQLFYCEKQRVNQYCFKFTNEGIIAIDPTYLHYIWTFGDGTQSIGQNVEHCFPAPGKYSVKLDIVNKNSGRIFFSKVSYNLELKDVEQPIINSPASAIIGESISFDGLKSYFPGSKILSYEWSFGDGDRIKIDHVSHSYREVGEYEVKLGLILQQEKTGVIYEACTSKQIKVFNNKQEKTGFDSQVIPPPPIVKISDYDHAFIRNMYTAEKDFNQDVVFHIEILNSKTKLGVDNIVFANVPKKYAVKEIQLHTDNSFSYIIAEEMTLMATYSAYNEIVDLGFKDTRIRTYLLEDPAAKELNTLKKVFGVSTDVFFISNDFSLTSAGTQMLDLLIGFMSKYTGIKLEISTHTDNTGSPNTNMLLSQKRTDSMVNYMVKNGVSSLRIIGKSYGDTKPLVPNASEADRKLNRRVDFTIINK
jgi:outer membrane protein OmpA-like peptidoglycan-associated protein